MRYSFAFIFSSKKNFNFKKLIKSSTDHFGIEFYLNFKNNATALSDNNDMIIDIRSNKICFSILSELNLEEHIDNIKSYLKKYMINTNEVVGLRYYNSNIIKKFDLINELQVLS